MRDGHCSSISPQDAHEYGQPVFIYRCSGILPDSAYKGVISTWMRGVRRSFHSKIHNMGCFVQQNINHSTESPSVNGHGQLAIRTIEQSAFLSRYEFRYSFV